MASLKKSYPGMPEKIGKGQVQSLSRAFALLESVAGAGVGLGLGQLAARMDLAPSTVHRLLNSMRALGYVECDTVSGLWSVGLKAFTVGNAYLRKRDFVTQARPFMKKLVLDVGETVNMALLDGAHIVTIAQVECREVMRMAVPIGTRGPVHASALGKILLAGRDEQDVRAFLKHVNFEALTEKTHRSAASLMTELVQIRAQGYAVDEQEQTPGMRCVAAAIYDEHQEVLAAISISGPAVRLKREDIAGVGRAVMHMAADITRSIGGHDIQEEE